MNCSGRICCKTGIGYELALPWTIRYVIYHIMDFSVLYIVRTRITMTV